MKTLSRVGQTKDKRTYFLGTLSIHGMDTLSSRIDPPPFG